MATFERGKKFFELSNHLGNVLVTIRDDKKAVSANGTTIDYYMPNIVSANDYYPFGMQMPGRKFNAGGYRYGFNGKENDNEIKGDGAQYDYGFRIYDPRMGKFLSVDPLTKSYPHYSPYQYAGNKPIAAIDLDGLEDKIVIKDWKDGKVIVTTTTNYEYVKYELPALPKELKLVPGVGTLTIDKQRFSGFGILGQNDYNDFIYRKEENSFEMDYAREYTNWFMDWGAKGSKSIQDNTKTAAYGLEISSSLLSIKNSNLPSGQGEIKVTNTTEASQYRVGEVNLSNTISVTGSANTSADIQYSNEKQKIPIEGFLYLSLSNDTKLPSVGTSLEDRTTFKLGYLRIDLTTSKLNEVSKLRIGLTTNPSLLQVKYEPIRAKATLRVDNF